MLDLAHLTGFRRDHHRSATQVVLRDDLTILPRRGEMGLDCSGDPNIIQRIS